MSPGLHRRDTLQQNVRTGTSAGGGDCGSHFSAIFRNFAIFCNFFLQFFAGFSQLFLSCPRFVLVGAFYLCAQLLQNNNIFGAVLGQIVKSGGTRRLFDMEHSSWMWGVSTDFHRLAVLNGF